MTKQEFLEKLASGLTGTGDEAQILDFYQEMIEDRMEDGMTEEEAVEQLGSVEEILAQCVQSVTVVPHRDGAGACAGEIRRVILREREFDFQICPTEEAHYRLEGLDERYHAVSLENGTLRILRNREQPPRYLFCSRSEEITLFLPRGSYESLDITTASGSMEITQDFGEVRVAGASSDVSLSGTFGRVEIQTASGDVELRGRFSGGVRVQTASGDVNVKEAGFGTVSLRTASGDMALHNVLAETLELGSASGDMDLNRVCGQSLTLGSKSSDINLMDTLSKGSLRCKTVSGDVYLDRADGKDMELETVSGDISGNLLHGKNFTTHTVSGDMNVAGGIPMGNCRITTVSGDVNLGIAEE